MRNLVDSQEPVLSTAATISPADYQNRAGTRVSWSELRVQREEIRLPRHAAPPPPRGR